MFQRGGRGDPRSCKGMEPNQKLQSLFPGFLSKPPFLGCSRPLIIPSTMTTLMQTAPSQSTNMPNIFIQWVETPPGSPAAQKPMRPPGFADKGRSLQEDEAHITINLPTVLATSPGLSVETAMATMMSTWLCQDITMGVIYVDIVTASHNLGAIPYGGRLPHIHPGGCHGAGVRRLSAVAAISTQCCQHWCPIFPTMAVVCHNPV